MESFGFELRSHRFQTVSAFKVFFSFYAARFRDFSGFFTDSGNGSGDPLSSTSCVTNDVRLQVHVPGRGFPRTV